LLLFIQVSNLLNHTRSVAIEEGIIIESICMNATTRQRLVDINRIFYSEYADSFASTRRRIQPGVRSLLESLPDEGDWLDLGCGSGWLALEWVKAGRRSGYLGLDFSPGLLESAALQLTQEFGEAPARIQFRSADLSQADWSRLLPAQSYRGALCFAVLHHLPGQQQRLAFLREAARLIQPGGTLALSAWQFQNSPKLRARQVDWSLAGLNAQDLEEGDVLLDWRQEADREPGLRYVHQFTAAELAGLALACGFRLEAQFESDGANGRLGLYQVWVK
jgi:tRNA (uracil-5-)-methyltransferase TRM9